MANLAYKTAHERQDNCAGIIDSESLYIEYWRSVFLFERKKHIFLHQTKFEI